MPKFLIFFKSIFVLLLLTGYIFPNKLLSSDSIPITLADPTIFYHKGTYYLYGTGGSNSTNQGFVVYTSPDMKTWTGPVGASGGYALKKGDVFGKTGFWAPQVFLYKSKFYMAYTADEQIAIAVSDSPLGPFRQQKKNPIKHIERNIDPFIFINDDGKKYLYHVIVANGANRIFVAEMNDDLSEIKQETLKKCIEANTTWENTDNAEWPVTEGPTVIKKNGLYYLIYSANDFRNPDYAVGYAVSKTPTGPWQKYTGNPLLSKKNTGMNGSGHGDLFEDAKGKWHYIFHTHYSDKTVAPRKTAIVNVETPSASAKKFVFDAGNFYYLKAKPLAK